jgi:hypothetical protein
VSIIPGLQDQVFYNEICGNIFLHTLIVVTNDNISGD